MAAAQEKTDAGLVRIHRAGVQSEYAMIPNSTARDPRLSWGARGLLVHILSHPRDWRTTQRLLLMQAHRERGPNTGDGRDLLARYFAELNAAGYHYRKKIRGPDGRFATQLHFYDTTQDPAAPGWHAARAATRGARGVSAGRTGSQVSGTRLSGTRSSGTRKTEDPVAGTPSLRRTTKTEHKDGPGKKVDVNARTPERAGRPVARDQDDDDLTKIAGEELAALGRPVTPAQAAEAARRILAGREVRPEARGAYVRTSIREHPERYAPTPTPPRPPRPADDRADPGKVPEWAEARALIKGKAHGGGADPAAASAEDG